MRLGFARDNEDDGENRDSNIFPRNKRGQGTRLLFRHVFEKSELFFFSLSFFFKKRPFIRGYAGWEEESAKHEKILPKSGDLSIDGNIVYTFSMMINYC